MSNGVDRWIWFVIGNLLALAAVCPFVGSLSDIFGRRWIAIFGGLLIVLGMIVCSTAHHMNVFIGGMVIAGAGAGFNELTALAATSEMAPTAKRGKYVAILVFTILPFCPSVLWAQLIADRAGWRYVGLLCGVWAFVGVVLTAAFYFPPPRVNSSGQSRAEVIKQIDYVGGFLSVGGLVLFMMALQWGGYQYAWTSTHVLVPLFLGAFLCALFVVWEMKFAKHPMFPRRILQAPRILLMTLIITFISGANFFSVLLFWPTQAYNVYGHNPIGVGVRALPIGFSILAGACVILWLLSVTKGKIRELMIFSSICMTAGIGSLAVARTDNLNTVIGLLFLAGFGIGGIVVPASIISTIVCPDDLIATISALTLSIRVLGGSIGYAVYYNVFAHKLEPQLKYYIGGVMTRRLNITNPIVIRHAIELTVAAELEKIHLLPGLSNPAASGAVIKAGQLAYAAAYKYVYLVSIAFGAISIIAAFFLGDIESFMDDHVAVVMH
jgi:MFS family permease